MEGVTEFDERVLELSRDIRVRPLAETEEDVEFDDLVEVPTLERVLVPVVVRPLTPLEERPVV